MDNEAMFRPFAPLEEPAGDGTSGDGWYIVLPVPEGAQSLEEVAARFVPDGYARRPLEIPRRVGPSDGLRRSLRSQGRRGS